MGGPTVVSAEIAAQLRSAITTDEIIELEKSLIRIPSYTLQETALAQFIVAFLQAEGISARLQQVDVPAYLSPGATTGHSHNVVAVLPGRGGGASLLFNGHMDINATDLAVGGTAFTGYSTWVRDPFAPVLEAGRIYGKGAYDEKGGVCAFLAAMVAIKRADVGLRGDIYACPVMGHYSESIGTKHLMLAGPRTTYGICSENSSNWIVPAHNGGVVAEAIIRGANPGTRYSLPETMNDATAFANAIRFVQALGTEGVPHPAGGWITCVPHPLFHAFPSHRVGYIKSVAGALDRVAVGILIKTTPGMDAGSCRRNLESVAGRLKCEYHDFHAESITTRLWAPPLNTPFESPIVTALSSAHRIVTGKDPAIGIEARLGAIGDSGCMADAGIETCIFGPGILHDREQLRGTVPPDESISVEELETAVHTMALAAAHVCA